MMKSKFQFYVISFLLLVLAVCAVRITLFFYECGCGVPQPLVPEATHIINRLPEILDGGTWTQQRDKTWRFTPKVKPKKLKYGVDMPYTTTLGMNQKENNGLSSHSRSKVSAVPEPSSVLMFGLSLLLFYKGCK